MPPEGERLHALPARLADGRQMFGDLHRGDVVCHRLHRPHGCFAYSLAPNQSTTTTGSSPTTHASCPLGSDVTSPGRATNSVPSSIAIASSPPSWDWKCGASQLAVSAIGLTLSGHRHPGSNARRPISASPTCKISACPFGNSRPSSGDPNARCSVRCIVAPFPPVFQPVFPLVPTSRILTY